MFTSRRLLILFIGLIVLGSGFLAVSSSRPAAAQASCDSGTCKFARLADPKQTKLDLAEVGKIDLTAIPVVPEINGYARAIYEEGQRKGNNSKVFSKIGDCMTANDFFLIPIGKGDYNLANYASLKKIIDRYSEVMVRDNFNSFSNPSLAATSGFNAAGVLDSSWSGPKFFAWDGWPASLENRVAKPGLAR